MLIPESPEPQVNERNTTKQATEPCKAEGGSPAANDLFSCGAGIAERKETTGCRPQRNEDTLAEVAPLWGSR